MGAHFERPLRGTFTKGFQEMPTYPIFHRWSARLIAMVEAETYPRALELAVARVSGCCTQTWKESRYGEHP